MTYLDKRNKTGLHSAIVLFVFVFVFGFFFSKNLKKQNTSALITVDFIEK